MSFINYMKKKNQEIVKEICDQFSTPQSIFFMGLHFLELTKELKKYKMKTKPAIRRPFTNLYLYYELYLYFHQYL